MRRRVVVVEERVHRPPQRDGVEPGQLRPRGLDQARELLEGPAALLRREGGPGWEGGLGGGDGFVDVLSRGFADWGLGGRDVVSPMFM